MVPAPQHFPSGCRFHPRCAFARLPECGGTMPQLEAVAAGHLVRCSYADALGEPRRMDAAMEGGA